MSTYLQDLDDVRALIQLYIDGSNGDVAKLKKAFHPDARMFGHIGPMAPTSPSQASSTWCRPSRAWPDRSTGPQ